MEKIISGIYKITNIVTGYCYIGSSKNIKERWASHKWPSTWKSNPNKQLYKDMNELGVDMFVFEVLAEVEPGSLKEAEQQFIETLKPIYNDRNANGLDIERKKKTHKKANKEYKKTDKYKKYQKEYEKSDKRKKYHKEYNKSEKYKKYQDKYLNQQCLYNGETITLNALRCRFIRQGIPHPTLEAKKYLMV